MNLHLGSLKINTAISKKYIASNIYNKMFAKIDTMLNTLMNDNNSNELTMFDNVKLANMTQ